LLLNSLALLFSISTAAATKAAGTNYHLRSQISRLLLLPSLFIALA
jgi:hypothetical protein